MEQNDDRRDDRQKDDRMNPDMDQILASIRRVIAEDGESPGGAASSDVERVTPVAAPTSPSIPASTPARTLTPTPRATPPMRERPQMRSPVGGVPGLLTQENKRVAETAFENLAEGRASARPADEAAFKAVLESVLIPLLREWLNRNMPPMVERIVQEEIDRITKPL